jgi:hypothetical protein
MFLIELLFSAGISPALLNGMLVAAGMMALEFLSTVVHYY